MAKQQLHLTRQQRIQRRQKIISDLAKFDNNNPLNKIYSTISPSRETLADIISDDALTPSASLRERQKSEQGFSLNNISVRDCIQAADEDEIDDILDRLLDELIVYGHNTNKFCEPNYAIIDALDIDDAEKTIIKDGLAAAFSKVYRLLKLSRHKYSSGSIDANALAKEWLTVGKKAWFIVYDNVEKPTTIDNIVEIDMVKYTIIRHEELIPVKKDNIIIEHERVVYWTIHENTGFNSVTGQVTYNSQHAEFTYSIRNGTGLRSIFVENEIILVDWRNAETTMSAKFSYVSKLIRPFRILRIMERTRIMWAVMNARHRTMYTIPVKGQGRTRGKQTLNEARTEYKDKIDFNSSTGELTINGSADLPFNKEIWVGETASGVPKIDTLNDRGPDLSDTSVLEPFRQKLQKSSKMPMSRYEDSNSIYWDSNPLQVSLDERKFAKLIDKIQQIFVECVRKPMYIQFLLTNPKYIGDTTIFDAIGIYCNKYSKFDSMMELELLKSTADAIKSAYDGLKVVNKDGIEVPVLSMNWLIEKYMDMSKEDTERNAELLRPEVANTAIKAAKDKADSAY